MHVISNFGLSTPITEHGKLASLINNKTKIACGIPVYLPNQLFFQSLKSILGQTVDLSIVLVDDCSPDSEENFSKLELEFADHKDLYLIKRSERVGQLINTREARQICKMLFPKMEFYFLGSDHDIWNSHYLEKALDAFEHDESIAIVSPGGMKISVEASYLEFEKYSASKSFYSVENNSMGLASNSFIKRIFSTSSQLSAGNMIYGVEKVSLTSEIPYYEPVLGPDRLFLMRVLMRYKIYQLSEVTWLRVVTSKFSAKRQLMNLFGQIPESTPNRLFRLLPDAHHAWKIASTRTEKLPHRIIVVVTITVKILKSKVQKILKRLRKNFIR